MGTVQNCYNTGMVSPAVGSTAGSVGGIAANNTGTVRNCVSLGAVVGVGQGGSRVAPDGTLTDNYARADMIVGSGQVSRGTASDRHGADLTAGAAQAWGAWFDAATADTAWDTFPTSALTQGVALPTLAALPEGAAQAPTLPGVPTQLKLDQTSLTLYANPSRVEGLKVPQTAALKAALDMEGVEVAWTSSDERIAAVDQNGVVTAAVTAEAKTGGKATITATCMGLTATCEVTVYKVREAAIQDLPENPQNNAYYAYPIWLEKDLFWVRKMLTGSLTYEGTAFLLMNDLSLTSGGGNGFLTGTNIPIGTNSAPFKGTFEGQGHTVSLSGHQRPYRLAPGPVRLLCRRHYPGPDGGGQRDGQIRRGRHRGHQFTGQDRKLREQGHGQRRQHIRQLCRLHRRRGGQHLLRRGGGLPERGRGDLLLREQDDFQPFL